MQEGKDQLHARVKAVYRTRLREESFVSITFPQSLFPFHAVLASTAPDETRPFDQEPGASAAVAPASSAPAAAPASAAPASALASALTSALTSAPASAPATSTATSIPTTTAGP
ncbi:hypothetical protein CF327_g6840 [Tilletia walkeri]|uniref:Uncharacterized protein n=1 Tax=Tilletia walkeri TaxID=117179 RepID=A0A8X7T2Y3_9BASI|nr:hypothetical protein CF327_g6840 [Tilletia walkeri]KAE8265570.1 hypothetical protein A4X09_0g6603 [Tilletia walkeri]